MSLTVQKITQGDTLSLTLKIDSSQTITLNPSQEYFISYTGFLPKVHVLNINNAVWYSVFFIFRKIGATAEQETIRVTSVALGIKNRTFKNDSNCQLVYYSKGQRPFEIDINIRIVKPTLNQFIELYNDEDIADFELRVENGSVKFHKAVLMISSPVLKGMLSGQWKETAQGHVSVPGISMNTIQEFKDYIYKSTVPEKVSLELLSLASYFMMTELEEICLEKLADDLNSENAWTQLEYCVSQKLTKLLPVILNRLSLRCRQDDDNDSDDDDDDCS